MATLVSIIIPFYNRFDLVEEAMNMIAKQTYKNFEVVLINDGSEGEFLLDKIKAECFFLIKYEELGKNFGPGVARRKGRMIAEGEFIVYLDSDDWWSHNFIEECVRAIEADPGLGMVYSNTVTIKNGVEINRRVNDIVAQNILPSLFINDKRLWSTTSCLWRKETSLPEHWRSFRDHEDYIHDVLSSQKNNKIKFVKDCRTYKNQSALQRIQRDPEEVRKALTTVLHIEQLPITKGISHFFLKKMYKNKLKIEVKELPKVITLPLREFRLFSNKWLLFQVLVLFNMLGIKFKFQKRNIEKLKP